MSLTNPTVTAGLRTKYPTDNYETHDDEFGAGGLRSKQSTADLDLIPVKRRKSYMVVNVRNYQGSPRPFWLASPDNSITNLSNNAFWVPIPFENWIDLTVTGGYTYKGDFNATTGLIVNGVNSGDTLDNSPLTPTGTNNGDYYRASTAGTYDFDSTLSITNEVVGSGNAATKQFTGNLINVPVNVSSISFTDDTGTPQVITDDGAGNLVGDVDGAGNNTINYVTGAYDVTFAAAPPNGTDNITVDYDYGEFIFAVGDRAIWNGTSWVIDTIGSASVAWTSITGMPQIIEDIGDGSFVPVSQTDFNTLESGVNLNTAKLTTLILGAGTDISLINATDIITKQMLQANYYDTTYIDSMETDLQADIAAIINDSPSSVDQVVGSYTAYVGRTTDTYSSSLIEDKLLDVYNAAIADATGTGGIFANVSTITGLFDGVTLDIDLGEVTDALLVALVGSVPQTETSGYVLNNTGATTIVEFAGTAATFLDVKYEIKYIVGIGDANETDPIFVASEAYSITATNKSNWTQAFNKYVTGGTLTGTDLILDTRDGGTLTGIDLSSLSGGGTVLNPLTENYLSKANTAGDNLLNSQLYDDGTDIGIFITSLIGGALTVKKTQITKPLVLFDNVATTGDVLRLNTPTSSSGKLLSGYRGIVETMSITSTGYGTFEKLYLKSPQNLSTVNTTFLLSDNTTKEISTFDGTVDLDFVLGQGSSASTRAGTVQSWTLEDLAGGGDIIVGADNLGGLTPITIDSSLDLTGGVLSATNNYTFSNGLTETGGAVSLGGSFTSNLEIKSDNNDFLVRVYSPNEGAWDNLTQLRLTSSSAQLLYYEQVGFLQNEILVDSQGAKVKAQDRAGKPEMAWIDNKIEIRGVNTSGFAGLMYQNPDSNMVTNWGIIDSTNYYIPHIGWIENRYLGLAGGTLTGGLTLGNITGSENILYTDTNGLLQAVTLDSSLALAGGILSATGGGGSTTLAGLTDTTIASPSANQFLRYVGGTWINQTYNPTLDEVTLNGNVANQQVNLNNDGIALNFGSSVDEIFTGIYFAGRSTITANPTDTLLRINPSSSFTEIAMNTGTSGFSISGDVNITGDISATNLATVATTNSYNDLDNLPTLITTLAGLGDTTLSGIGTNHYLGYNGSAWVNRQIAYSEISGTPTIPSINITDTYVPVGDTGDLVDSPIAIDASGRITLQASSPLGAGRLESYMNSATEHALVAENADTSGTAARFNLATGATTSAEYINFYKGTTRNAYIRSDGKGYFSNHNISALAGGGVLPLKVDNIGDVTASQIDYDTEITNLPTILAQTEAGWTPTITTVTITPNTSVCRYTKTENLVHLSFSFTLPITADGSAFEIDGLPFTPAYVAYGVIGAQDYSPAGPVTDYLLAINGSGNLVISSTKSGAAVMINSDFSQQAIFGSITYQV